MYKKKPEPAPTTANADGSMNVLVEFRTDINAAPSQALQEAQTLLADCEIDESYEPVLMANGTAIIRCRVRTSADIEKLKRRPKVVAVWTDTPIAPMTPR
jgi:hypothetical protein